MGSSLRLTRAFLCNSRLLNLNRIYVPSFSTNLRTTTTASCTDCTSSTPPHIHQICSAKEAATVPPVPPSPPTGPTKVGGRDVGNDGNGDGEVKVPKGETTCETNTSFENDELGNEWDEEASAAELTPAKIVEELDRHIVGQHAAKRAMAIALRNRWRRLRLDQSLQNEVLPKNILAIGPTGVGKTEIARRLSKLVDAPFVKVEATKFTEVGFHGRDVDQIIRDLLDNAINLTKRKQRRGITQRLKLIVENRILDELSGKSTATSAQTREQLRALLRSGALDHQEIDIDPPPSRPQSLVHINDLTPDRMQDVFSRIDKLFTVRSSSAASKKRVKISEARPILTEMEAEKLLSDENVTKQAIHLCENHGIVIIDEIDKICTPSSYRHGADASTEGVQRDLLPLIEGTTVTTKHGNVNTDHILFVAAGAFTQSKPSDLMAELQGRLPIRVELKGLGEAELYSILTVPEANLILQQIGLMATEGVELEFTDAAIREIARVTAEVNATVENIGARRLNTVLERIVEGVSFNAPAMKGSKVVIDAVEVQGALGDMVTKSDLTKFIL